MNIVFESKEKELEARGKESFADVEDIDCFIDTFINITDRAAGMLETAADIKKAICDIMKDNHIVKIEKPPHTIVVKGDEVFFTKDDCANTPVTL